MIDVIINGIHFVPAATVPVSTISLGDLLRDRRDKMRLSLDDASSEIGISKTYLWQLESGRSTDPSLSTAIKIVDFYGLSLNDVAATMRGCDPAATKQQ